jgi:hypothetical protein
MRLLEILKELGKQALLKHGPDWLEGLTKHIEDLLEEAEEIILEDNP